MRNFKRSRSGSFHKKFNKSSRFYKIKSRSNNRYRKQHSSINPKKLIKKAVDKIDQPYIPKNSFSDFDLDKKVKINIRNRGFTKPTPIQDQAINHIIAGRDFIGIANTGTGKTAAFLLPLITKVIRNRKQKVLIITPTRELAAQIQNELRLFCINIKIFSSLCIGGSSIRVQIRQLSNKPDFVIGTPGRLKDLAERKVLKLNQYTNVVLDEVDRMLDMGFIRDVRKIISFLAKDRQSLFFSATIPNKIKPVMNTFLVNPITVSVKTSETPKNVDQDIIRTKGKNKLEILHDLLIKEEFQKVLVFGRTKHGINKLEAKLNNRGFKVAAIHGNKSQNQRLKALKLLKNNQVRILLATDVASRGLDIKNITHVINYDMPASYNDYIHRIGRTGRIGKKGKALTFV